METKAFWQSTTLQGAVVAFLGFVSLVLKAIFKVEIISNDEINSLVGGLFGLIGLVMIVIGRFKTTPGVKLGWKNSK